MGIVPPTYGCRASYVWALCLVDREVEFCVIRPPLVGCFLYICFNVLCVCVTTQRFELISQRQIVKINRIPTEPPGLPVAQEYSSVDNIK